MFRRLRLAAAAALTVFGGVLAWAGVADAQNIASYVGVDGHKVSVSATNPLPVTGGGGGGGGAVTGAATSFADGWNVTMGLKADAATCATGNSEMACLRQLHADIAGAIPAGANTIGAVNQGTSPWVTNPTSDTHGQCSALCANLVVKASTGVLKTFEVSADSTLSAAIWYVMVYDATSAPVDGAVTPAKCYQQPSGTTQMGGTLAPGGTAYLTGITIGVSTTGCFTKTASTHAFIAADFQ